MYIQFPVLLHVGSILWHNDKQLDGDGDGDGMCKRAFTRRFDFVVQNSVMLFPYVAFVFRMNFTNTFFYVVSRPIYIFLYL